MGASKVGFGSVENGRRDLHQDYPQDRLCEVPFSSARKLMITVHELKGDEFENIRLISRTSDSFTHIAVLKGAPERVIEHARTLPRISKNGTVSICSDYKITDDQLHQIAQQNSEMSSVRILGLKIPQTFSFI